MATCRLIAIFGGSVNPDILFVTVLWHTLNGFFNALWFSYSRNLITQLKTKIDSKYTEVGQIVESISLQSEEK